VRLLIDSGADEDIRDHVGQTALMIAASRGHSECARLFVQDVAKIDLTDKNQGRTTSSATIEEQRLLK
jgi:ankyrin repeat protein